MRLILVRDGETLWNETHKFQGFSDIALGSKGRSQAQSLAESLEAGTLAAIYTSPLIRARLTAELIARYHDCPMVIDEGLKELNQGQLEGLITDHLAENPGRRAQGNLKRDKKGGIRKNGRNSESP
jgi:broad specificity phosphatase PhoE